jgi:hypothetical protein
MNKSLASLTRRRRKMIQTNNIRGQKVISQQIPMNSLIIGEYFENLWSNTLENLEEMDNFLGTLIVPIKIEPRGYKLP